MKSRNWHEVKVKDRDLKSQSGGWSLCSSCHGEFGGSNEPLLQTASRVDILWLKNLRSSAVSRSTSP